MQEDRFFSEQWGEGLQPEDIDEILSERRVAVRGPDRDYALDKVLGTGGFSEVFASGPNVLKITRQTAMTEAEIEIHRALTERCPDSVVRLLASFEFVAENGQRWLALVQERAKKDLLAWNAIRWLRPSDIGALLVRLLRCAAELHSAGIAHMDIKPENVMCERAPDGELRVKLIDFGLAHRKGKEHYQLWGTYISPDLLYEALRQGRKALEISFSQATRLDLWCVGCTVVCAFSDLFPQDLCEKLDAADVYALKSGEYAAQRQKIKPGERLIVRPEVDVDPRVLRVLERLLDYSQTELSARDLLRELVEA